MKTPFIHLTLLLATMAVSSTPSQIPNVPPEHKEAAEKTFASGRPYFIWMTGKQPVIGRANPRISSASIPIKWAAKYPNERALKKTPFKLRADSATADGTGKTNIYDSVWGPVQELSRRGARWASASRSLVAGVAVPRDAEPRPARRVVFPDWMRETPARKAHE